MDLSPDSLSGDSNLSSVHEVEYVTRSDLVSAPGEIPLYGYQGATTFKPESLKSYRSAVRALLSVRYGERRHFSLVWYNKNDTVCDSIDDTIPKTDAAEVDDVRPDPLRALVLRFLREFLERGAGQHLFVMLRAEGTPFHWRPSEYELRTNVVAMVDRNAHRKSISYLWFPVASAIPGHTPIHWDMGKYSQCFQAALTIVTGEPWKAAAPSLPLEIGLGAAGKTEKYCWFHQPSSFLLSTLHNRMKEGRLGRVRVRELPHSLNDINIVMPSYYPTSEVAINQTVFRYSATKGNDTMVHEFLAQIRAMIRTALCGEATSTTEDERFGTDPYDEEDIQQIAIIELDGALDTEGTEPLPIWRNVPMDATRPLGPALRQDILNVIRTSAKHERSIYIHPIFNLDTKEISRRVLDGGLNFFSRPWRLPLPSIEKPLGDFWKLALWLADASGKWGFHHRQEDVMYLQIRPCIPEPALRAGVQPATYFVRRDMDNGDWFSIRTQIITWECEIAIVDARDAAFAIRPPETNIWGPRYVDACHFGKVTHDEDLAEDDEYSDDGDGYGDGHGDGSGDDNDDHDNRDDDDDDGHDDDDDGDGDTPVDHGYLHRDDFIQAPGSLPGVSRGVLTPTEQVRLQTAYRNLLKVKLYRAIPCPQEDCSAMFKHGEAKELSDHYQTHHSQEHHSQEQPPGERQRRPQENQPVVKCPWCDEVLSTSWGVHRKGRHFRENHRKELLQILDIKKSDIPRSKKRKVKELDDTSSRRHEDSEADKDAGSLPEDEVYCSRCLRGFPPTETSDPNARPSRDDQMRLHIDPDRLCRIRNAQGCSENLPNITGWIRRKDLQRKIGGDSLHNLAILKHKFVTRYPGYGPTIYWASKPTLAPGMLGLDPNTALDAEAVRLPWPPISSTRDDKTSDIQLETIQEKADGHDKHQSSKKQSSHAPEPRDKRPSSSSLAPYSKSAGKVPVLTVSDSDDSLVFSSSEQLDTPATTPQSRKYNRKRLREEKDGPYAYVSDPDSADDLQPDVDDLIPFKLQRLKPPIYRPLQTGPPPKEVLQFDVNGTANYKRRRVEDPTYRPSKGDPTSEDDELQFNVDDQAPHKPRRIVDPTYCPTQAELQTPEVDVLVEKPKPTAKGRTVGKAKATPKTTKGKAPAATVEEVVIETVSRTSKLSAAPKKATTTKKKTAQKVPANRRVTRSVSKAAKERGEPSLLE